MKKSPRRAEKTKGSKGKKGAKKATKGGTKGGDKSGKAGDTNAAATGVSKITESKKAEDSKQLGSEKTAKPPNSTEISTVERSKTLPLRREETTVTLQDGKIAVDVYVPDDQSILTLNDTVRVIKDDKKKDGMKSITKSKTTLGTTKPDSSKDIREKGNSEKADNKQSPKHIAKGEKLNKTDNKTTGKKSDKTGEKKPGAAKKKKKKK